MLIKWDYLIMEIKQIRVDNLKRFVTEQGGAAALARKYEEIDASYISQLINGHRPFGEKSARNIEKICKLNPNYFDQVEGVKQSRSEYNVIESTISIKKCPVISWVKAGEMCDPCHVSSFDDAEDWLICGTQHSDKTYALLIVGDSMAPEYQEGWHIFVDPEIQAKHNDDVIVRDEQGKATFKRLQITPEGQYLLALNPDHPQRKIQVPEGSTICGVIIYSGRKRK